MSKSPYHRIYCDVVDRYVVFEPKRRMTEFHKWMMWVCSEALNKSRSFHRLNGFIEIVAVRDYNVDARLPDIYTPFFDVECETGLKYSYEDLKTRILTTKKTVIVVLPNERVKGRYLAHVSVRKQHLKICTLKEFPKVVSDILKNADPYLDRLF